MFSLWKYFTNEQIQKLENEYSDNEAIKSLLSEFLLQSSSPSISAIFSHNQQLRSFYVNFHYYNYSFCKEEGYNNSKISTFLSIMNDIFINDMLTNHAQPAQSNHQTMQQSFQQFSTLILKHSVERPPKSILIFDRKDVPKMLQYVTDSYYRKFHLYKYLFSTKVIHIFQQTLPQEVESPQHFPSLQQAIIISSQPSSSSLSSSR